MVCRVCEKFKTCDSPYRGDSSMVQCGYYEKVKPTNADRIRSMGDIELGNFLSGLCSGCVNCPMYLYEETDTDCGTHCNSSWQNWLKQECEMGESESEL